MENKRNSCSGNLIYYFIAIFITEFSRTIPHAFVTIYLLQSNFELAQISMIQIPYMILIFLFEIPSGILCDFYNKKKIFVLSNLFLAIAYFIYFINPIFWMIVVAQCFYGLSTAFYTGTIDSIILSELNSEKDSQRKIELFFRRETIVLEIAMILGATIGSYLYFHFLGKFVYMISIIGYFIASIFACFIKDN